MTHEHSPLGRILAGNVQAVGDLPDDVSALEVSEHLVLGPEAVARVLSDLDRGVVDGKSAQQWASFIRHGYLASSSDRGPVTPIFLPYEASHEDSIVEAIARLDEIGDMIDGHVPTSDEIADLLANMGQSRHPER